MEDECGYSPRFIRFVRAHREAFDAAYLDGNPRAASNEMTRLEREFKTLPPRHACSCPHRNPRNGIVEYHCLECRRVAQQLAEVQEPVEIGRGAMVNAPMPSVLLLDLNAGYATRARE